MACRQAVCLGLPIKDESMSTSGYSQKSFRADGRVYGHIMDPRTGYPARGIQQVSVVAPRALDSEAWAKASFVNGRHWSAGHIPADFRVLLREEGMGRFLCVWLP